MLIVRTDEGEGSPPHAGKGPSINAPYVVGRWLTPARGEGTAKGVPADMIAGAHPRTRGRDMTA